MTFVTDGQLLLYINLTSHRGRNNHFCDRRTDGRTAPIIYKSSSFSLSSSSSPYGLLCLALSCRCLPIKCILSCKSQHQYIFNTTQRLSARLGMVTGKHLAELCYENLHPVSFLLFFLQFVNIASWTFFN